MVKSLPEDEFHVTHNAAISFICFGIRCLMSCNLKLTVIIVSLNELRVMFSHSDIIALSFPPKRRPCVLDRHISVHKFSMCDNNRFSGTSVTIYFIRNIRRQLQVFG